MFHSRNATNTIKRIYDKCTFEEILEKDKSLTVHDCNKQTLSKELFKVDNNLPPTIFSDLLIR